jgi:hypothetical protein
VKLGLHLWYDLAAELHFTTPIQVLWTPSNLKSRLNTTKPYRNGKMASKLLDKGSSRVSEKLPAQVPSVHGQMSSRTTISRALRQLLPMHHTRPWYCCDRLTNTRRKRTRSTLEHEEATHSVVHFLVTQTGSYAVFLSDDSYLRM